MTINANNYLNSIQFNFIIKIQEFDKNQQYDKILPGYSLWQDNNKVQRR